MKLENKIALLTLSNPPIYPSKLCASFWKNRSWPAFSSW